MSNIVEFIYRLQDRVTKPMANVITTATRVAVQMQKTQQRFDGAARSAENLGSKVGMLSGSFDKLIKYGAGYLGVMQAIRGTQAFLNMGMDMEQTRAKFEVLLGSLEKGNKMIADINQLANITPFENQDLVKNSELLLAFGYDANKIIPTMKMLGDVAMGDANKLSGITLAFAQMSSTGKLMGQDLLQMINQGFNPLLEISKKTGKPMGELKELMSQGKISAEMVEQAFKDATAEGGQFYNMMDKMSQTGSGKLSTLLGNLKQKLTELSERFTPILIRVIDFGITVVNNFERITSVVWKLLAPVRALFTGFFTLISFFRKNIPVFVAFTVVMASYKVLMWSAALATKGWTIATMLQYKWLLLVERAQKLLNLALVKNPITAVIAAISLLVGAFIMLRKKTRDANDEIRKINATAGQYAAEEKARLDIIFDKLKQTNPKTKERNDLVKQLQDMYPDVIKNMDLEKAGLQDLEKAYDNIVNAIDRKARARAFEDTLVEEYKLLDALKNEIEDAQKGYDTAKNRNTQDVIYGGESGVGAKFSTSVAEQNALSKLNNLEADLVSQNKKIDKIRASANDSYSGASTGGAEGEGTIIATSGANGSISDLTGGGSKVQNVTINLRNLIENFNLRTETFKEGADAASDELVEAMLRVLNSSNRIATQ